eukprot:COSAG02_NODE_32396_length_517_cov_0.555024_1_plen_63_part_10
MSHEAGQLHADERNPLFGWYYGSYSSRSMSSGTREALRLRTSAACWTVAHNGQLKTVQKSSGQ